MARKVFNECINCFKTKPVIVKQVMGDLPWQRLEPSRPFFVCGINFAGPIAIRNNARQNTSNNEGYLCIIV